MPLSGSGLWAGATGSTTRPEAARASANALSPGAGSEKRMGMPIAATPETVSRSMSSA